MPMSNTEAQVLETVDARKDVIIDFARHLLQIPSVNTPPSGQEKECQLFISEKLRELGLQVDIFTPTDVKGIEDHPAFAPYGGMGPRRDYTDRPNVVGTWKGLGDGRSLILSGHVDVVPIGPREGWTYDPWGADIHEGRIFARGAVDMKGGLASMIMAVQCLKEIGIDLKGDVIFESVVDEEFAGANGTLAAILRGYEADAAIIGEATNFRICPATYGCFSFQVEMLGLAAHPYFKWKGVDLIEKGYQLYKSLIELEHIRGEAGRKRPLFSSSPVPAPILVPIFHVGELEGGAMGEQSFLQVWVSTFPGETLEGVLDQIRDYIKVVVDNDPWLRKNPPKIRTLGRYLEPCEISPRHPIVQTLEYTVGEVTQGKPEVTAGSSCDLFLFNNYSKTPGILFGPGELYCAHRVDEFLSVEDLIKATKIYALAALKWCGQAE